MDKPTVWGIDCDVLAYSVGFVTQKDGIVSPPATAIALLEEKIHGIMERVGCLDARLYLTGEGNYREAIALPEHKYKGHRKSEKPVHFKTLRAHMIHELGAEVINGAEADDALARGAYLHGHGIATIDKDLNMVAGWHYNWMKDVIKCVSPEQGRLFFYRQMLTGDSADNIPGLFRLTGKKATAPVMRPLDHMDSEQEMYEYVRWVYQEAGLKDADKVLQVIGTQLWMDIYEDRAWHPPEE